MVEDMYVFIWGFVNCVNVNWGSFFPFFGTFYELGFDRRSLTCR